MIRTSTEGEGVSGPRPAITVVVPTYRRAALLPRLVTALERPDIDVDIEVVIVDNDSPDDTAQVLRRLQSQTSLALEIRIAHRRGPGAARNVGWHAARAPLIAFIDDDCVPTATWLRELAAVLTRTSVAVGRTIPDPAQASSLGPFSRTLSVTADDGLYRTCNIGYHRSVLEELDGFDERFDSGGEDTDLGYRAMAAGARAEFATAALVHHDVRPSRWTRRMGDTTGWESLPLVIAKHPELRNLLYARVFWRRTHPSALAALLGLMAACGSKSAGRRAVAAALIAPYLRDRLVVDPLPDIGRRDRALLLPAALAVDLAEIAVLAVGSGKHRTILL
jgi:GT2 family glycosyltransferase